MDADRHSNRFQLILKQDYPGLNVDVQVERLWSWFSDPFPTLLAEDDFGGPFTLLALLLVIVVSNNFGHKHRVSSLQKVQGHDADIVLPCFHA